MRTGVIHFLDDKRGTGAIDQRDGDVIVFRTAGLNSALSQFIGQVEGKVFSLRTPPAMLANDVTLLSKMMLEMMIFILACSLLVPCGYQE